MIISDVYFTTGSTHAICQDYAAMSDKRLHAIISDGCSSVPNTDFGSRLLTRAAEQWLETSPDMPLDLFYRSVIVSAQAFANSLFLPWDCLCATLGIVWLDLNHLKFRASLVGDGAIIARRRDNKELVVDEIVFPDSTPYYLRYSLDEATKKGYLAEHGKFEVRRHTGEVQHDAVTTGYYVKDYPLDEFDLVGVTSDGISSFTKLNKSETSLTNAAVPSLKVIEDFFAYKNYNGAFVQRRCARVLKDYKNEGITHSDDISIAVVGSTS